MADEAEEMTEAEKVEQAEMLGTFAGEKAPPETTEPPVAASADEPKPGEEPPAEPQAEPQVEYVQITREEAETFRKNAAVLASLQNEVRGIRTVADRAHGISGDVQKQLREFASATGREIPVTKEDFKELAEEYGDVADKLVTGLQRSLKRMPGGNAAAVRAEVDPAAVSDLVRKEIQKVDLEELHRVYPDWRETTQAFDGGDPNCEYRAWLRSKPVDYQELMAKTGSGGDVRRSIDWFHAEKRVAQTTTQPARAATTTPAKPAQRPLPRTAVRQPDRFRAAVAPNGEARPAAAEPSELDEVMAAFRGS